MSVAISSAGQSLLALDGTLSQADAQGLTLTRLIGTLSMGSSTVAGAWGTGRLAVGVGIASREAFTAGIVPDPRSETEEPPRGWVYKTIEGIAQNGISTPVLTHVRFDIRSQRKLDSGRLYLALDYDSELGTTFVARVFGLVRALYLLP